jgi:alcohol dehydrogenase (NADP+)
VIASGEQSLRDLQLDYLDLYLVHWPFPNDHPPSCDIHSCSRDAKRHVHDNFMTTWCQMEALVDRGPVRHIGTSNMTIAKLRLVLRDARIRPACNQMELHPHFQQPALFQFVCEQGMVPIGYCLIGSPNRPDRDRTVTNTVDVEDAVIVRIAKRLDVAPGVVCIKWAVQRGQTSTPFSVKRAQFVSSLRAVVADPLTNQEMSDIAAIDRNCRLIKGQVFLWRDAQSWEDRWDPTGDITPP